MLNSHTPYPIHFRSRILLGNSFSLNGTLLALHWIWCLNNTGDDNWSGRKLKHN